MTDRIPHQDVADDVERILNGKIDWLERFSDGRNKRPDHEIQAQQRHVEILRQVLSDYRRAAQRQQEAA